MTDEERTFRRLCQVPIQDLDDEYRKRYIEFYSNPDVFQEWLDKNGWFEKEFYDAGHLYEHQQKLAGTWHKR